MKKKRFSEEQIVQILKEMEAGATAGEVARRHGVSTTTVFRWKAKYGGMDVNETRRLKQLEEENRRLKRLVADKELNIQVLKDLLGKDS